MFQLLLAVSCVSNYWLPIITCHGVGGGPGNYIGFLITVIVFDPIDCKSSYHSEVAPYGASNKGYRKETVRLTHVKQYLSINRRPTMLVVLVSNYSRMINENLCAASCGV